MLNVRDWVVWLFTASEPARRSAATCRYGRHATLLRLCSKFKCLVASADSIFAIVLHRQRVVRRFSLMLSQLST